MQGPQARRQPNCTAPQAQPQGVGAKRNLEPQGRTGIQDLDTGKEHENHGKSEP